MDRPDEPIQLAPGIRLTIVVIAIMVLVAAAVLAYASTLT